MGSSHGTDLDMQENRSGMGSTNESDHPSFQELTTTIVTRLKASPQYSERRCIYRVPNYLRQVNEQAYTPMLVSIGPLHHKNEKLLPMEAHKLKFLESFLRDANNQTNTDLLNSCLGIVKNCETEIRESYADPIDLSSDDFTQMVLIDSVFIIELCRRNSPLTSPVEDDFVFNRPFLSFTVLHDMQLEENQLPFFILNKLYRAAFETKASDSNSVPSFTEIACEFLDVNLDHGNTYIDQVNYSHLLHLLAYQRQPGGTTIIINDKEEIKLTAEDSVNIPSATTLHEAGVKFLVIKDSSSLFDFEFDTKKGILKMPKLEVHDEIEHLHRNVIAFEQCHYNPVEETRYFTDYHIFLNCLINTPEDVQLLVDAGIIENSLGSPNQVSDLINSLDTRTYISLQCYCYRKITLQLIRHSERRWNRYRATLMHTYFNHPWAIISVVYAFVLLVLTIIQVVTGFKN